jgi:hypothetical protein
MGYFMGFDFLRWFSGNLVSLRKNEGTAQAPEAPGSQKMILILHDALSYFNGHSRILNWRYLPYIRPM